VTPRSLKCLSMLLQLLMQSRLILDSSPDVLKVGAYTKEYARSHPVRQLHGGKASNYGSSVNIWAPGTGLYLPCTDTKSPWAQRTGTHYAAAFVASFLAGVVALEGLHNDANSVKWAYARVISNGMHVKLSNIPEADDDGPGILLNSGYNHPLKEKGMAYFVHPAFPFGGPQ
jgi:hypothetical protein